MIDDEIEAWLKKAEMRLLSQQEDELNDSFVHEDADKLLSLVRVYRKANQFYGDEENWKEGRLINIDPFPKGDGDGPFYKPCKALFIQDSKARFAETRAKEIIK